MEELAAKIKDKDHEIQIMSARGQQIEEKELENKRLMEQVLKDKKQI